MATPDPWYLQAFAILEAHKDGATIVIALLSTIIALIATIAGPAISVRIAKKQITSGFATQQQQTDTAIRVARLNFNASVVSTSRQKWVDNFRDTVAELVTLQMIVGAALRTGDKDDAVLKPALERIGRILGLYVKVELFLDPNEPGHLEFRDLIQRLQSAAVTRYTTNLGVAAPGEAEPNRFESEAGEVILRAQLILNAELNRVRGGEPERS